MPNKRESEKMAKTHNSIIVVVIQMNEFDHTTIKNSDNITLDINAVFPFMLLQSLKKKCVM